MKAYTSIPHLPGSRTGSSDRHLSQVQARRCTEQAKPGDRIIVQEKLDGTCVAVKRQGNSVVALGRSGDRAARSRFIGRRHFAAWVEAHRERFLHLLEDGERLVGEWLSIAHGTRYALHHEPFVVFDLFLDNNTPLTLEAMESRLEGGFQLPAVVHNARSACSVDTALRQLGECGQHGARDFVEGAIWRVEREGRLKLVTKFVQDHKIDGRYLADQTGKDHIWNSWPSQTIDRRGEPWEPQL